MVHFPAAKTHYSKDIVFDKDTLIFATGKQPIVFIKNAILDKCETEMMSVRWKSVISIVKFPRETKRQLHNAPSVLLLLH